MGPASAANGPALQSQYERMPLADTQLAASGDAQPASARYTAQQYPAVAPLSTEPAKQTASERAYGKGLDGMYLGADHQAYAPNTRLDKIPAFQPRQRSAAADALYVNGILVGAERQAGTASSGAKTSEAQEVADAFGYRVRPVHNESKGVFADSIETVGDIVGATSEPAVVTLVGSMLDHIRRGKRMTYVGHSQGASQIARALEISIATLRRERPAISDAELHQLLAASIHVITLGGSAARWPDGPEYDHYINTDDAVPKLMGVDSWFAHGGVNARFHRFTVTSTRKDEQGLAGGESNMFGMITNAINRRTHGVGLYTNAASQATIEQADGAKPVPVTHSGK